MENNSSSQAGRWNGATLPFSMLQFYPCYNGAMAQADLGQLLGIGRGSCIALVGGGGKTTTMESLARFAGAGGHRVALTTTTKICVPDGIPLLLRSDTLNLHAELSHAFASSSLVAVADSAREDGKLIGLPPEMVSGLLPGGADVVVCEADGSRRRPLKVHGPGEPVIPEASTHVLILAGLDAVGRPAEEVVHRVERFAALTGTDPSDPITPIHVAQVLSAALTHVPAGAAPVLLLNKADSPQRIGFAHEVARCLERLAPHATVYATSRGTVVEDLTSIYSY